MFIISFVFLGRTTLWNWHFWLRTLSLVLVENKSDNFVKYFDQSELKLEESGLLTRKNISLDNPLWRWICVPWLLFFFYFFSVRLPLYQSQTCQRVHYMKVLFLSDPTPNQTFVSNFPSPHLGWHLLFLGQGEVSPGCDGDPPVTGVAAPAHDAKPVIVTHSPVVTIAELIDFIWFWIRRLNGW